MSTIATAYNSIEDSACAKVVQAIDKINSQALVKYPTGVLDALQSQQNKGTFSLDLTPNKDRPTTGSFRKVNTKDIAPNCTTNSTADSVCTAPSFSADDVAGAYLFAEHEINSSIKREIILDLEEFKKFCISPTEYIADRLIGLSQGVLAEIDTKLTTKVAAYMGKYKGQVAPNNSISAPKDVSFLTSNTMGGFLFDPTGYAKIKDEYSKLGFAYDSPIIVGGSHIGVFQTSAQFMGGANINGVSNGVVPNLFVDYNVDAFFNDNGNHLLTWKPGAIQVVSVNGITDDMIRMSTQNVQERMRVKSPFGDGFEWEFYFDKDLSTGCKYRMKWQLWFDAIVPIPYDGTCVGKPILHFGTNCYGNTCPN